MFTKRIIPCLDVKNGRVVKGVNFVDLKDAGDPVEIAKAYDKAGADEVVFLDITASSDQRGTVVDMVRKVAATFLSRSPSAAESVPWMISRCCSAKEPIKSRSTPLPSTIRSSSTTRHRNSAASAWSLRSTPRKERTEAAGISIKTAAASMSHRCRCVGKKARKPCAGEILLTSMDCDGTKAGYDIELTRTIAESVGIPVIASGGAGTLEHFYDALTEGKADAALAASLFHYKELEIREVKEYLAGRNVPVRL